MPREYRTFGKPGQRLSESSRRVLAFIRANPGLSRKQLVAAFPDIQLDAKLQSLQAMDLVFGERLVDMPLLRFYARLQPQLVDQVKLRGPVHGPIAAPRERDMHAPWREPYLTDVGVRRDGLQYRDCPSRRGTALVYCYRRHA